eukprot:4548735-Heterocapsa_arctica.AAC.1
MCRNAPADCIVMNDLNKLINLLLRRHLFGSRDLMISSGSLSLGSDCVGLTTTAGSLTLTLLLASVHHLVHIFPDVVREGQVFVFEVFKVARPYLRAAGAALCRLLSVWSQLALAF